MPPPHLPEDHTADVAWARETDLGPSEPRPDDAPRLSDDLALRLHDAGLAWQPAEGDRFVIPDRDLDDQVFSISPMSVDVRTGPAGRLITFNGAVEWALDAIEHHEVVWLPTETQLRERLADRLLALVRTSDGYRCEIEVEGRRWTFADHNAVEVYGRALLAVLESGHPYPGRSPGDV